MNEGSKRIGCIDGQVLDVRRSAHEVCLTVADTRVRLSTEAASLLAVLLTAGPPATAHAGHDAEPERSPTASGRSVSRPSDQAARDPRSVGSRPKHRETVADLVNAGIIGPGTILTMTHRGQACHATVTADGLIEIDGRRFYSPSGAAEHVKGASVNGWTAWRDMGGALLTELRWRLRVHRFPGQEHDYAESTADEKQRVAGWWVDHALSSGLDPAERNDEAVEAVLGRREYAETTLESYRRHLDQWFELHRRRR